MRSRFRALLLVLATSAACKGKKDVRLEIAIPASVAPTAAWFEVAAFRDTGCGPLGAILRAGIPDGAHTRVAFRRDDPISPKFGNLPPGSYAFAAVARDGDCAVLAAGCADVTIGDDESVLIPMAETPEKAGACGPGAACEAARCVPANDNADPSVGANCSLELLGAGPLATPLGADALVSAPEIAATPSGFVIVYREVGASATSARITILPIDPAGGALPPGRPLLVGRCASADETDGIGLVLDGSDGQIVVVRPACGTAPALELLNFSSKPEVSNDDAAHLLPLPTVKTISLSPSGVTALRTGGNVIAVVADGVASAATVTADGVTGPAGTFGATSGNTGAWAAASESVLALLAAGPLSAGTGPTDAGASDGGTDGSATDSGIDDGSATQAEGPQLRLQLLSPATPLGDLAAPDAPRRPITFPGAWGAVAARGARVIVISDSSSPGGSVTYRTFDANKTDVVETSGFSVAGTEKVSNVDLVMQDDRVFFAVLKPGRVALHAYAGASTTPRPLRAVDFSKEPRIPAIRQVRDGKVAIAATESRVAVAWTTAKVLTRDDPSGGYAVFACTQ